jgi:hypothetical protein
MQQFVVHQRATSPVEGEIAYIMSSTADMALYSGDVFEITTFFSNRPQARPKMTDFPVFSNS